MWIQRGFDNVNLTRGKFLSKNNSFVLNETEPCGTLFIFSSQVLL